MSYDPPHPVLFDQIDGDLIKKSALRVRGSAGPSGLDASYYWRCLCSSYNASPDLCDVIALVTRRLCTSFVDPTSVSALVASRLITLDKNPGVRPIGVGETLRRIICKSVLLTTRNDIQDAGQDSGCEAAFHSIHQLYLSYDSEAVLFVDAENAFNSLNRTAALHNILHLFLHSVTSLLTSTETP